MEAFSDLFGQIPMTINEGTPISLLVENICKRFGSLEVLRGISLTAYENDVITLLGASGSGKSTLLRCINLLETPDSGKVYVRGELIEMSTNRDGQAVPTNRRQVSRIRARLGMVFQQFNLWSHLTVLQNVIEAPIHVLGLQRREAIERAQELLEKVGLSDKLDYYPSHLSGGQEQRAAIARALAMEPDLILFDEPTSALDPELVGEVLKVIQNLASEGCTMLIVTHELNFARDVSSQTVFLDQGRIEEQGSPDNVLDNPQSERLKRFLSGNYRRTI
tara:strand:- start:387 stop:1217 length:831 start_codon:yes stop_codon:yes gene_type:complete